MLRRIYLLTFTAAALGSTLAAQRPATDSTLLTVDRIFASPEFRGGSFGPLAWLSDGVAYTTLERPAGGSRGAISCATTPKRGCGRFSSPPRA